MQVKITKTKVLITATLLLGIYVFSSPGPVKEISSNVKMPIDSKQLTDLTGQKENNLICGNKTRLKNKISHKATITGPSEYSDSMSINFKQGTGLEKYEQKELGAFQCRKGKKTGENPKNQYCSTKYYSDGLILQYEKVEDNQIVENGNVTINKVVLHENNSVKSLSCSATIR